jgi:RimJ/RimL family protein N-acetyltransferase
MHQPKMKSSPFRVDEPQRSHSNGDVQVRCVKMTKDSRDDALILLNTFLREDEYYLASSEVYGDKGLPALKRALDTFILRPELGFVWLAYVDDVPTGVCVVSYAISTSIGGLVAKLDDVFIISEMQRQGVATEMLLALARQLRAEGVRRIDTSVYSDNRAAEAYYDKLGFKTLGEERLALVL